MIREIYIYQFDISDASNSLKMANLEMIVFNTSFSAATKGATISYDQQEPGCTDPKPTQITIVNQLPIGNT
jgi:hypothetical protein